jgi:hypothetical protein
MVWVPHIFIPSRIADTICIPQYQLPKQVWQDAASRPICVVSGGYLDAKWQGLAAREPSPPTAPGCVLLFYF